MELTSIVNPSRGFAYRPGQDVLMVPPSITMSDPTMLVAASETMKATSAATLPEVGGDETRQGPLPDQALD